MIFWKTSTQTLPLKNPKNPEINPETWYVNKVFFDNYDLLYITEKLLKNAIQWYCFYSRI